MAYSGTNGQEIVGTYPQVRNQTQISYSYWYLRSGNGTRQGCTFGTANGNILGVYHWTDNNIYAQNETPTSGFAFGFVAQAGVSGWNHLALVYDGTQSTNALRCRAFFNGTQQTLSFSGVIPSTTADTATVETFQVNEIIFHQSAGSYAEIGAWQGLLTDNEIRSLWRGMSPKLIQPNSLFLHLPLTRNIQDTISATALTNISMTVATHPRIYQ